MKEGMLSLKKMVMGKGKFLYINGFLGIVLAMFIVTGCGGGSGDGGNETASLLQGNFVDSPVEGLEYETQTQMGATDEEAGRAGL